MLVSSFLNLDAVCTAEASSRCGKHESLKFQEHWADHVRFFRRGGNFGTAGTFGQRFGKWGRSAGSGKPPEVRFRKRSCR